VNETADIERAIGLVLNDGPLPLVVVEDRLPVGMRADGRGWIDVAVNRMLGDGRIRAVGCDCPILAGACVVEAVR